MKGVEDSSFDASFSFEATPHGNDLAVVYREVYRALKPGALFVDVTWCVTDDYDLQNPEHLEAVNGVLVRMCAHPRVVRAGIKKVFPLLQELVELK
jgi:SAM-dependent methyltransferase